MKRIVLSLPIVLALACSDNKQTQESSSKTIQALAGLVAAYSFDQGAGTTTPDASGNGNTGTISGATWVTAGKYGGALQFDGSNDRININDSASLDLTTGVTVLAWVRPASPTSSWRTIVIKEHPNDAASYSLMLNALRPESYLEIGNTERELASSSAIPVNTWTHVAMTYGDGTQKLGPTQLFVGRSWKRVTRWCADCGAMKLDRKARWLRPTQRSGPG